MSIASGESIEDFLHINPGWSFENQSLSKTYQLKDFSEAMGFVVRLGIAAERADHHPDIDIRWNKVTVSWSTHSEGGVTEKDIEMAEESDALID